MFRKTKTNNLFLVITLLYMEILYLVQILLIFCAILNIKIVILIG